MHLYTADGAEYLDVYNNVPSVGHAHPRVTAAIAEQAATLNTHTRYLHEGIVRYAEELLATLPRQLGHVMFTCTGSEAGDLALRIAKRHTGGTGVVVTRNAYHGVTTEIAAISPSLGGLAQPARLGALRPGAGCRRVSTGPGPGSPSMGEWFAAQVQDAIDDLARSASGSRPSCSTRCSPRTACSPTRAASWHRCARSSPEPAASTSPTRCSRASAAPATPSGASSGTAPRRRPSCPTW